MTLERLLAHMRRIQDEHDTERAHKFGDAILVAALALLAKDTPHEETVRQLIEAYKSRSKWYS